MKINQIELNFITFHGKFSAKFMWQAHRGGSNEAENLCFRQFLEVFCECFCKKSFKKVVFSKTKKDILLHFTTFCIREHEKTSIESNRKPVKSHT